MGGLGGLPALAGPAPTLGTRLRTSAECRPSCLRRTQRGFRSPGLLRRLQERPFSTWGIHLNHTIQDGRGTRTRLEKRVSGLRSAPALNPFLRQGLMRLRLRLKRPVVHPRATTEPTGEFFVLHLACIQTVPMCALGFVSQRLSKTRKQREPVLTNTPVSVPRWANSLPLHHARVITKSLFNGRIQRLHAQLVIGPLAFPLRCLNSI